jgi:exodeoxyribonuclease V alpha subunit
MPDARLFARAFADQCRRWAVALGADAAAVEAAARAGAWLAEAAADGHVGLALDAAAARGIAPDALAASGLIGPPASGKPFVRDAQGRLYLARHYHAEATLAARLLARHRQPPVPPGPAARRLLAEFFPDPSVDSDQKRAVALALCRRLAIISGGPGTGKTTSVACLIACHLADAPDSRLALAAPTGKAAARLQESLAAQAADWPAARAARLPARASTLHRLLGIGRDGGCARYHAAHPLPVDLLVVDEASMLDLELAGRLVAALPPAARLVLLGDKDQLQAVEAGAVFAALCTPPARDPAMQALLAELGVPPDTPSDTPSDTPPDSPPDAAPATAPGPLADAVVWLQKSRRFAPDAPLGRLAEALRKGDVPAAEAGFVDMPPGAPVDVAGKSPLQALERPGPGLHADEVAALLAGYAPYRAALAAWQAGARDLEALFAGLAAFRVLCVTRRGARGVDGINARLARALRGPAGALGAWGLFPGQPLMIRRNDPATRLFNGDIGIALEEESGAGIWFPAPAGGHFRLAPARLPPWESALALTVHKAQGSEFARIALVLPEEDGPLLCRELVYTAVTRAQDGMCLLGRRALFAQAVARPGQRSGGLADRLREAAASP